MGTQERKQREKLHRNAQILDAARSLFIEKGYNSATMQDIADRAELGRRTLYMYFKTKDEIVSSIALEIIGELCRIVKDASFRGLNGRERMENVAQCFVEYYRSRPGDFLLILNAGSSASDEDGAERGGRIELFLTTLTELLTDILEAGVDDGSLRPSGSPVALTAGTIVTSILGTLKVLALSSSSEKERDEQLVHLIRLLTNSLIPSQGD